MGNTIKFQVALRHAERIRLAKKNRGEVSRMINTALAHFRNAVYGSVVLAKNKTKPAYFIPTNGNLLFLKKAGASLSMSQIINAALDHHRK
jgi:hypothetical protein